MSNLISFLGGDVIASFGDSDRTQDPRHLFRELAIAYSNYASEVGVQLCPFNDESLPLFSAMSADDQRGVISALRRSVAICERTRAADGTSLKDSPALIWQAMREFGLRPPSDVFSYITGDSIVEIHSPEGVQIFRSFSFYRYCSYTIEDLHCGSWSSLYERDHGIISRIIEYAGEIYSGQVKNTIPTRLPTHVVREVSSHMRYEIELSIDWVAPLFAEGTQDVAASIVIENARFLSSTQGIAPSIGAPSPISGARPVLV